MDDYSYIRGAKSTEISAIQYHRHSERVWHVGAASSILRAALLFVWQYYGGRRTMLTVKRGLLGVKGGELRARAPHYSWAVGHRTEGDGK